MTDSTPHPGHEPTPFDYGSSGPTQRFSALQRLWTSFASPAQTFSDIAVKPTWVVILVVLVLLGLAVQFALIPHVDTEATLRARLGDRAEDVSDERIEQMVEQGEKFARFGPLIGLVVSPIAWAAMAAIFFVLLKIVGSDTDFLRAFSTVLHAYWPPALVASVLTIVLVQRVGKIPQQELTDIVKSHPGALLSPDAPAWLSAAASTFSVFNIWTVILLVVGFRVVGRISTAKALVVALVPWLAWLAAKSAMAAAFA